VGQVLLVRHGQASWGADDYDVLSPLGERQATVTGAFLAGVRPDAVLAAQEQAQPRDFDGEPDAHQFQAWFEKATARWRSGAHDGEYAESWPEFRDRVLAGLDALGDGTTVVVTSGGPISVVVAHLLESSAAYQRIAPVVVNASVTKVVIGRRGHTLVSFNEHGHLPGDLLTYR
jgi:broad specificity phosphatase PhoE